MIVVAALAAFLCTAQPQSSLPPRDSGARESKVAGVIRGRVTSLDSGRPLRRAQVTLSPLFPGEHRFAGTGSDGTYEFRDLPPGRYRLTVKRSGYLPLVYGQRGVGDVGRHIDLEARSAIENVDVALTRMSVISGRVTDEAGEPIPGVTVTAVQPRPQLGRPQLAKGWAIVAQTDDGGRYRILGLSAGDYLVMAFTPETWISDESTREPMSYAASYYPATSALSEAQRIHVPPAWEVSAIDLSLIPKRSVSVRGVVLDARGTPLAGHAISLLRTLYRSGAAYVLAGGQGTYAGRDETIRTNDDGSWLFDNVRPGDYRLFVKSAGGGGTPDQGDLPLVVDGIALDGIVVVAGPGGTIRGRVEVDDLARLAMPLTDLSVRARGVGPDPPRLASLAGPGNGRVAADGTFEYKGTFGQTMISLEPNAKQWTVRAILRGERDITGTPIELKHGEVANDIRIVLSTKPALLEGELKDADGNGVDGTVIVFPEDVSQWIDGSPLLRGVRSDRAGRFTVDGLPPGRYRCVGVDYIEDGAWTDATILEPLSKGAPSVTLRDGHVERMVLRVRR